jgi:hypothetical protein
LSDSAQGYGVAVKFRLYVADLIRKSAARNGWADNEVEDNAMRNPHSAWVPVVLTAAAAMLFAAQAELPQVKSVAPDTAQAGDELTVTGEHLGSANLEALYLTDGQHDFRVVMLKQTETSITFRVPAEVKAGRFALMVLTKGDSPKLVELPVKVTIQ